MAPSSPSFDVLVGLVGRFAGYFLLKDGKLHFHAPGGGLVNSIALKLNKTWVRGSEENFSCIVDY